MIRARIVEVEQSAFKSLGIEWSTADWVASELDASGADTKSSTAMTGALGQTVPGALPTFTFTRVHPDSMVNLTLEALAQKGLVDVLAAPRLTTVNNKEAIITIADRVPVITREQTTTDSGAIEITESVEFLDAGLTLKILPRKVGEDHVLVNVGPEVTQLSGWTETDPAQPIMDTRSARTEVILKSKQWLVIGGLVTTNTEKLRKKIPLLGDIPLLGIAFRSSKRIKKKSDLLILINAEILQDEAIEEDTKKAEEEQEKIRRDAKKWDRFWDRDKKDRKR